MQFIAMVCCAWQCSPVGAAFVNITIENENAFFENHPNLAVRDAWNALGGTLDVYRVYANFDSASPSDRINAVFGTTELPSFLSATSGTFFNVIVPDGKGGVQHFDSPVSSSFYAANPAFAWDTFATIGFGPNNWQTGFFSPPGGAALNHLQTNWVNTTVMWEPGPGTPQHGDAVPGGPFGFRVGLFQATVAAGTQVWGQFALDTGHGIFWGDNTYFTTIPAPASSLALLALLFLQKRRR